MSLGSFIRSAARATSSAYRSVPIRWRLAGGSAALTFVILAGFAAIVGVLTDRQVRRQFNTQVESAAHQLRQQLGELHLSPRTAALDCDRHVRLSDYASPLNAQIRIFDQSDGAVACTQDEVLAKGERLSKATLQFPPPTESGSYDELGYRVDVLRLRVRPQGSDYVMLYGLPISDTEHTISKVRIFLLLGVVGGTIFALAAGLATAQRAIRPIRLLSAAAREVERTRDPSRQIPHPEADDEVAELARTLDGMLQALDGARGETEAMLARQREFVADASHELRTPLTSVLANLELLADELSGEQADSAKSALRSTRRMRRLVGDLLLLARVDARRTPTYRPTDLADVLTDAAAELGSVSAAHELTIEAGTAVVDGSRDDLHRLVLNLLENALRHTPPGTEIRASTETVAGEPTLIVEDDGPGIPPDLRRRVFERFVRAGGDGGRGSGLGLAIVHAVAESHGATIWTGPPPSGVGTRFEIRFAQGTTPPAGTPPAGETDRQTSTTTGSTIGRRRSRS